MVPTEEAATEGLLQGHRDGKQQPPPSLHHLAITRSLSYLSYLMWEYWNVLNLLSLPHSDVGT